jgi:uncharacterized NAD(P)/FAD-binding protein YdhS
MNIAVIGGGLSGTLLTYYLLEEDAIPMTIFLFEKDYQQFGRGIAYRSSNDGQLLNVPASKMNFYGQQEGTFYQWLCNKITDENKPAPMDFVERAWFGSYLKELFEHRSASTRNIKLRLITDEVVDIVKDEDTLRLFTESNHEYRASYAVLANGILPPADPFKISTDIKLSGLYQSNPWSFKYLQQIKENDHVMLIGTGLTMLDHAVSLLKSNKNLSITALSRRGFLPLPHANYDAYNFPDYNVVPCEDISELYRSVRAYYDENKKYGLEWRCLIDKIRLQVPELWQALNSESKKRFIRHLKPYWEIHRHRAPQQILQLLTKAANEGRFKLLKGRVNQVQFVNATTLQLTVCNSQRSTSIETNYLLNSTGLQNNIRLTADHLLRSLMKRGHMHPDINGLGIEVDEHGALFCTHGKKNIFSLGALRRAAEFECTAAKEIGEQAFKLSQYLLKVCLNTAKQL